jgi:Family of unknown function (DUF5367)
MKNEVSLMVYFPLFGTSLWLIATLIFRAFGTNLLDVERPLVLVALFAAVPIMAIPLLPALKRIPVNMRLPGTVLIALPGMLLDIFSLIFHESVFPALHPQQITLLAAWLLWAYGIIISCGFIKKQATPKS